MGTTALDSVKDITSGAAGGVAQVLIGQPFGVGACVSIQFGAFQFFRRRLEEFRGIIPADSKASSKSLSLSDFYLIGGAAGLTNSIISGPIEHVRIRLQTQPSGAARLYSGPWDCVRKIAQHSGIKGLYRGQNVTLLREFHGYGIWFAAYEGFLSMAMAREGIEYRQDLASWKIAVCGGLAGEALWLGSHPLDVIKSKMQSDGFGGEQKYLTMRDAFRQTWREGRFRGLFRGLVPALLRAMPVSAGTFATAELYRYMSIASKTPQALPPHSKLPLKILLRSLLVATISCHQILLGPSLAILKFLNGSHRSWIFGVQRNPLLHTILKKTMYNHFCAGENRHEVASTIAEIKRMGFRGAILTYAREIVVDNTTEEESGRGLRAEDSVSEVGFDAGIDAWREGVLETADMLSEGDILALKLTGAGAAVSEALTSRKPLPAQMESALSDVCSRAVERGARIFMDAEQISVQPGIDTVAMELMRCFNTTGRRAVVFNTYQAYLKSTPDTLAQHMALAHKDEFVLGIKLVRGAYISSEPRHLINDTKEATDDSYDSIARGLLSQVYGDFGMPVGKSFPRAELFLATHNKNSVLKANALQQTRAKEGRPLIKIQYGQLLGMADEVSFSLLQLADQGPNAKDSGSGAPIEVYKCLSWGSLGDCTSYLLRRAVENRDAVSRTKSEFIALKRELWRRLTSSN
ncbi:proline dehydrogenase [Colletotrichum sp. CLE4]